MPFPGKIILLLLLCLLPSEMPAAGSVGAINLNHYDAYVRRGFSPDYIRGIPELNSGWTHLKGEPSGQRAISIPALKFDGVPRRGFLSLKFYPPESFTIITSFIMPESGLKDGPIRALKIAFISQNWEIFLNGISIAREIYTDQSGNILTNRTTHGAVIPIHPANLKKGMNILAYHIIGDPTSRHTGLMYREPYLIDDYARLQNERTEYLSMALIAVYYFIGLYHLVLFLYRRQEKYNLHFGMFAFTASTYMLARTGVLYRIIDHSTIILNIEYLSLFWVIASFGFFIDTILDGRLSRFTKIYASFAAVLMLADLFAPLTMKQDLLLMWQGTAIIPIVYYIFITIGRRFYGDARIYYYSKNRFGVYPAFRAALKTFLKTVSGNLLLGVLITAACTIFDIAAAAFFGYGIVTSKYGFAIFVMGIMLVLTNRFQYVHKKIELLNSILEDKVESLNEANRHITVSEEKYRLLVEGSNDFIFSIGADSRFITASGKVREFIKPPMPPLEQLSIYDLIHDASDPESTNYRIIRGKLESVFRENRSDQFKINFISAFGGEPREMQLRLEPVAVSGRQEVLGKASSVIEDSLLKYFLSERQRYYISNYLITADEVSYRMTRNLSRYMEHRDIALLRIAIREIIINAIEHGNLEVTFEEKSEALMNDSYREMLIARQKDEKYSGRMVEILYSINEERAAYRITDEGRGFDFMQYQDRDLNREQLYHGRGLIMAFEIFDTVKFNSKGNQVLLVKKFIEDTEQVSSPEDK